MGKRGTALSSGCLLQKRSTIAKLWTVSQLPRSWTASLSGQVPPRIQAPTFNRRTPSISSSRSIYSGICEMKAGGSAELHPEVRHHRNRFWCEARDRRVCRRVYPGWASRADDSGKDKHRGRSIAFQCWWPAMWGAWCGSAECRPMQLRYHCAERDWDGARKSHVQCHAPTASRPAEISKKAEPIAWHVSIPARFGLAQNILAEAQLVFDERVEIPNDGHRYWICCITPGRVFAALQRVMRSPWRLWVNSDVAYWSGFDVKRASIDHPMCAVPIRSLWELLRGATCAHNLFNRSIATGSSSMLWPRPGTTVMSTGMPRSRSAAA